MAQIHNPVAAYEREIRELREQLKTIEDLVPGEGDVVARVRDKLRGWNALSKSHDGLNSACLEYEREVTELRQALANAREDGPWAWCTGEDNHLESMSPLMVIRISAGQLRELMRQADAERDAAIKHRDLAMEQHAMLNEMLTEQLTASQEERDGMVAHLQAKLAALADAAERYRRNAHPNDSWHEAVFGMAALDTAIAEARKALP